MSSKIWLSCCLSAGIIAGCPADGQNEASPSPEPKIGLVLEGGAALGLAHIGVIQWLEEHRIPVSYVAGTSMGGLVGGLYATGNSPAEIQKLVDGIDWDVVLRGEVPYRDLSFRRKEDAEQYPNGLQFGIKDGLRFPEGFNSGHQVGLILDQIAVPYSGISSFDELPIPFACVGTELIHDKAHVFRDGQLSLALRSTMSLPGVFTPVRNGGNVYVDGGLLDNLPVDVAKQMGANLTIAIHLVEKPLGTDEPLSSVGVLGQSISVVIAANELRSIEMADILVPVPVEKYSGLDYKKSSELIKLGYEAAASKASVLSRLSVDEATWQAYLARRNARRKTMPAPQFVEVTGTKPKLATEIENQLSGYVGKPLDTVKFDKDLTYLLGNGRFSSLGYQMIEKDNRQGLQIIAREKEWSPPDVRPLIVIDGSEYNQVQFMLGARVTFYDLGGFGSEWRNDLTLGSQYGIQSEFYKPFGKKLQWFIAPRGYGFNAQQNYYERGTLLAEYRNREGGGNFDVGFVPSRVAEFRIGYRAAYQRLNPTIGDLPVGTVEGRVGETYLKFQLDGRNHPVIPTSGTDVLFTSSWFDANPGASAGFPVDELQITRFNPVQKGASIFFHAAGGSTFTYHQVGFPPFKLGGGPDLYAYGKNEFLTDQYYLFRAGYLHPILPLPPLVGDKMYAVVAAEGGKLFDLPPGTSTLPGDFTAAIVMNTLFGPVEIGGGFGATGHYKFFYQVGRVF